MMSADKGSSPALMCIAGMSPPRHAESILCTSEKNRLQGVKEALKNHLRECRSCSLRGALHHSPGYPPLWTVFRKCPECCVALDSRENVGER